MKKLNMALKIQASEQSIVYIINSNTIITIILK